MPPANSPADSRPHEPQRTNSPFGSALRQLASPVPDFASTLGIADDDVLDANVSFLRANADIDEEDPLASDLTLRELALESRRRRHLAQQVQPRELSNLERQYESQIQLHRAQLVQQRHESREAWAERMSTRDNAAYGDRIPDQQSLYDWAPAYGDHLGDTSEAEISRLVNIIREQQPNTHPDIVRALARVEYEAHRGPSPRRDSPSRSAQLTQHEPSLRSAAILQSVNRNWRFSTRSRALMSRYINDRDRAISDTTTTADAPAQARGQAQPSHVEDQFAMTNYTRSRGDLQDSLAAVEANLINLRRTQNRSPWPPTVPSTTIDRDTATLDSLRRRYLENPSTKVTEFEKIIKYLHRVRLEDAILDLTFPPTRNKSRRTLSMAQEVVRKMQHVRPHPTSWLTSGMTFTGHQQAAPVNTTTTPPIQRLANRSDQPQPQPPPAAAMISASLNTGSSTPWFSRTLTATPQPIPVTPAMPISSTPPIPDTWTVKVALHAIDYESMTIQGTMEAFNVPSFANIDNPTTHKTTFSTYLEGEIIDFSQHTLLTEADRHFALKTTPDIDAAYWRKLEPFAQLSDEEIARALLDKKWLEEQLMGKYVLMRWKERCFVRPTFTSFSNRNSSQPLDQVVEGTSQPPSSRLRAGTTSYLAGSDGLGYGLSISGFYYISMRRSDGRCEGLYFDPQSSPYQRLELVPTLAGLWGSGAWEMR